MSQTPDDKIVSLPDGRIVSFPGSMSDDAISNAIRLNLASEKTETLSPRDVSDLVEIRRRLPQDDPQVDLIDRLLFRQVPEQAQISQLPGAQDSFSGTFGGAMQAFTAAGNQAKQQLMQSNASPASAPQLKPNPISKINAGMTAALSGQRQATSADQEQFESGKQAGFISGATQVGLGALGPLAGPTRAVAQTGTGVLDASGNEIMREVTKFGPSLGKQGLQATVSWVSRHPLLAAAAYESARRAGIPLPNVIGWLARAGAETGAAK